MDTKEEKRGSRMNWEVGIDIYILLIQCIRYITSENLWYSTGNSTQCSANDLNWKEVEKRACVCVYVCYICICIYLYLYIYVNDYTVEVMSRFKGLDMVNSVPKELGIEVHKILLYHPKVKEMKEGKVIV